MVITDTIPAELKALNQWVLWHYEARKEQKKPTKVPYTVRGTHASSTNRNTWSSFEAVWERFNAPKTRYDGIGFVLTESDPFIGVDLDHCITDGAINSWAQEIVDTLNSYTEITPSNEGLRIFLTGSLPPQGRKTGQIEIYESERYLTITGNHLEGTPFTVNERQKEIASIHGAVFKAAPVAFPGTPQAQIIDSGHLTLDPEALPPFQKLIILREVRPEFRRSWDRTRAKTWSQSEYDLSIAHWTAIAGWSNQEIINSIICHRREHGENPEKALRLDYFTSPVYGILTKVQR